MDSPIAMGIDVSLTRSGVAFVGDPLDGGVETFSFGRKGSRSETIQMRNDRITTLADQVVDSIDEHMEYPRIACIEDVAYGATGGSVVDRIGLWWAIVNRLLRRGVYVLPINVATVKIYATGRGNRHEKDEVMLAIVRRYADAPIQNNDEADATALAMIGARVLGRPYESTLPATHLRALDKIERPNLGQEKT